MRFVIKHTGCGSERVGVLTGFLKSHTAVIETPTAALLTQGGSVVHLTAEVLSRVFSNPQLLWLPLSNIIQLETGVKAQNEGVAKFVGLPQHITCGTLHNVSEVTPSGHFEAEKVPLWTKRGKRMLTSDRYMDLMEVFKPDIILAIADGRTNLSETSKRVAKAVDRTCSMLNICVERYKSSDQLQKSSLIGVIVGAANLQRCEVCIKNVLKHIDSLHGVALEGLTDGTEESFNIEIDKVKDIIEKVGNALPDGLLKIVEGAWDPSVVLAAIELGWDVFDGSYVVKLTNAGLALKLNFDVNKVDDTPYILDMVDESYKEDFRPILEDCECLACKKHTRAYIRHLLNTREMLASVLLNIHNLHHYDQMFHHARVHIAAKTFAVFKEHITKQCEVYNKPIPYRYKGPSDISEERDSQRPKKIRINEEANGGDSVNVAK